MSKSVHYFRFYRQSQDGATILEEDDKWISTVGLGDVIVKTGQGWCNNSGGRVRSDWRRSTVPCVRVGMKHIIYKWCEADL